MIHMLPYFKLIVALYFGTYEKIIEKFISIEEFLDSLNKCS